MIVKSCTPRVSAKVFGIDSEYFGDAGCKQTSECDFYLTLTESLFPFNTDPLLHSNVDSRPSQSPMISFDTAGRNSVTKRIDGCKVVKVRGRIMTKC